MIATLTLEARRDLRRRAEAATRGRWAAATPSDDTPETSVEWVRDALLAPDAPAAGALWCTWAPDDDEVPGPRIIAVTGDGPHAEADADWIAAASPAAVLALLDALDDAEARIEALRALADWAGEAARLVGLGLMPPGPSLAVDATGGKS